MWQLQSFQGSTVLILLYVWQLKTSYYKMSPLVNVTLIEEPFKEAGLKWQSSVTVTCPKYQHAAIRFYQSNIKCQISIKAINAGIKSSSLKEE